MENMELEIQKLKNELKWYYRYMYYVAEVHNNIDAEACGYADGDIEYNENF